MNPIKNTLTSTTTTTTTTNLEMCVRLVAITNGNAQTDDIPCLKDLFEFCVLAEQVRPLLCPGNARLCALKHRAWRVVVPFCWPLSAQGVVFERKLYLFVALVLVCKPEGQARGCVGVLAFSFPSSSLIVIFSFFVLLVLTWLDFCRLVGCLTTMY